MKSTVKKFSLVALLLLLTFSLSGCLKSNEAQIKETINTFLQGIQNESKTQVMDTLDITLPFRDTYPVMLETYFSINETVSMTINYTTITVMDTAASVSGNTTEDFYWDGQRIVDTLPFTFTLVKRSGKWLISGENYLIPLFMD